MQYISSQLQIYLAYEISGEKKGIHMPIGKLKKNFEWICPIILKTQEQKKKEKKNNKKKE